MGMGLVAVFFLIFLKTLFPFVLGFMLCVQILRVPTNSRLVVSGLRLVVGLYALGYMIAIDGYAWVQYLPEFLQERSQTLLHTLGSLLIIYATITNVQIFQGLNGRLCSWLGRLSFPLYLVHGLVIYSISSYFYLLSSSSGLAAHWVLACTFFITVLCTVLVSLPLAVLDEWWVLQLKRWANRYLVQPK